MFFSPTKYKCFASLTLILLLLPASPAVAQQEAAPSPLAVSAQVDKAEVTIGDIVTYHLSIRHDPEIQLAIPHLEKQFDGFIFIDRETPATQKIGDQVLDEFKFRFRADKVGHYTQSEIAIHFTVPDSKDSGKLIPGQAKAPKTVVVVRSVLFLDGEPTDIPVPTSAAESSQNDDLALSTERLLYAHENYGRYNFSIDRVFTKPFGRRRAKRSKITTHRMAYSLW